MKLRKYSQRLFPQIIASPQPPDSRRFDAQIRQLSRTDKQGKTIRIRSYLIRNETRNRNSLANSVYRKSDL